MRNSGRESVFRFKQFSVINEASAMKVGTDGVLLGSWAFRNVENQSTGRVLDVGCGSGVISLMLAQRFPRWKIIGVDIMPEAIAESRLNFEKSLWGDRLMVIQKDFTRFRYDYPDSLYDSYDFIISNPPFFSNGDLSPDVSRRTARHEGTLNYISLLNEASELLPIGGRLAIISPADIREKIISEGLVKYLYPERICMVSTTAVKSPKRVMIEFVKGERNLKMKEDKLIIHSHNGGYTNQYVELVSDFYLYL